MYYTIAAVERWVEERDGLIVEAEITAFQADPITRLEEVRSRLYVQEVGTQDGKDADRGSYGGDGDGGGGRDGRNPRHYESNMTQRAYDKKEAVQLLQQACKSYDLELVAMFDFDQVYADQGIVTLPCINWLSGNCTTNNCTRPPFRRRGR